MPLPVWMLLGFATWTLLLLVGTVGVYRWWRILRGKAAISEFRADRVEGEDWYRRAMRAHANCIENLPVFGAIVFALQLRGVAGPVVNALAVAILAARVVQSLLHVTLPQTDRVAGARFAFFSVQFAAFFWLIALVIAG